MRILICNERFLFRFGVDRVLLLLGSYWKAAGHEIIMMGNKLDPAAVEKCSDRFIRIPECQDYINGNEFTVSYVKENWDSWFTKATAPDVILVAGWPYYSSLPFFRMKCGCLIFHDYGAVPTDGMSEGARRVQEKVAQQRRQYFCYADKIIAISKFLEDTQSKRDSKMVPPTCFVHLGADHFSINLWKKDDLGLKSDDTVAEVKALKAEGYKILFMPGRWENGNYKRSPASIGIIRRIRKQGLKIKVLVLASMDSMGPIPDDVRDSYYCLGYVDDDTMRQLMELSDAGFSPTSWEGFNLPLAEMQYLNKCMFVLNIGAHPEVAADPYFLCEDYDEMADKIVACLKGKLPFTGDHWLRICEKYRERLTWKKSADAVMAEIENTLKTNMVVFMDVTNACADTANSGVMRVTRKIAHHLQKMVSPVFVMWDASIGKYVFPYPAEVERLCSYGGPNAAAVGYQTPEGAPRLLLEDLLPDFGKQKKIFLFTETVYSATVQQAVCFFHSHEIPVAAIFYDAIAVLHPELCSKAVSENHVCYMQELSRCDLVIPIAAHNQTDLERFWDEKGIRRTLVKTVELAAEMDGVPRIRTASRRSSPVEILFVSTLEPRKNHVRLLKAFELVLKEHPELRQKVRLTMVGNRYAGRPEIASFVEDFCAAHKNVRWLGVVDDLKLKELYQNCSFTVYPSQIEGFGMPIIESLWFARPCLCSNQGSIGELGGKGGCCLTDVLDEKAMAGSLYRLITDEDYCRKLQDEAIHRRITTWEEYTSSLISHLLETRKTSEEDVTARIPVSVQLRMKDVLERCSRNRVLIVSNFYPPNFIGGAEIIAHNQALALTGRQLADVFVFSVDTTRTHQLGEIYCEEYGGIPVFRLALDGSSFNQAGINFFNEEVNSAFEGVCALIKPNIVHCHNIMGMSLGIIDIARRYHAKTCVTLHDNWGFCLKQTCLDNSSQLCSDIFHCEKCLPFLTDKGVSLPIAVRKRYFRRIFEKMDMYISPSSYLAKEYIKAGFNARKMNVLWNGIDLKKFAEVRHIESTDVRISFIGYVGEHKGIDILIRAVASLGKKNVRIIVAGAGDMTEKCRQLAGDLGIAGQVSFLGKVDNAAIGEVYAETDIYCLPSRWPENQPVTITEAMACYIPVVATDLGGCPELVEDGVTGFLFEKGNVKDLASKLEQLIDDPGPRNRFGRAGFDRISLDDFDAQVTKLNDLYLRMSAARNRYNQKPFLAVNKTIVPHGVDEVTLLDILPAEWVVDEDEWRNAAAYLIVPGDNATDEELEFVTEHKLKLILPSAAYAALKDEYDNALPYATYEQMLSRISQLSWGCVCEGGL